MALIKPTVTKHGIDVNEAYYRITEFFMSMNDFRVGMQLAMYANKDARDNNLEPISVTPYQVFDNGLVKQNRVYAFELTEGTSLSINDTVFQNDENLLANLQASAFANDLDFTLEGNVLTIAAKEGGMTQGAAGNELNIVGDAIGETVEYIAGQDERQSDFATFFDLPLLDALGSDPISQCYEYLKTLPEFADAVDA